MKYLIHVLIAIIACYSISPLLDNIGRQDWFETSVYQIFLIGGWAAFFTLFLLIGVILNRSKFKYPWEKVLNVFKYSLIIVVLIIGYGSVKYSVDFSTWKDNAKKRRAIEKRIEMKKQEPTNDSLLQKKYFDPKNSSDK